MSDPRTTRPVTLEGVPPPPAGMRFVRNAHNSLRLEYDTADGPVDVSTDGWLAARPVAPGAGWVPLDWPFEWWPLAASPDHVRHLVQTVDVYADLENMPAGPRSPEAACRAGRMLARRLVPVPAGSTFDSVYPPSADARAAWLTVRDALLAWCASADGGATPPAAPHPDGPDGGRWVWWRGERHDVPKGVVYRLIEHFWTRDSAGYDSLFRSVFDDQVEPQTVRSRCSAANKVLRCIGVGWRLAADSAARVVTKAPAPAP